MILFLFVGLPAALVSPAVLARRRSGVALASMGLGVFLAFGSFNEMLHAVVQYQRPGEWWDWLSCVWLGVSAGILGTGLMGLLRWRRLPRV